MQKTWWKKAVVYQIYPKSFLDTTGNGIGDLAGITRQLDYLQKLGVDVIWLTPIYASPQKDNGYDISDYYTINPEYGTMESFEDLLHEAHQRNIKLIMDIVVNHTSIEHEWFKQARSSKDNPYRDYYIWKDGVDGNPPTNWQSKFGGNAWEWDEQTGQYYLHLYDVTQADLNWENPRLRREIYDMMHFWLKKGVDGFRLDVINVISKDQSFQNDTLQSPMEDGRRFYTDGPRIHEYLKEMNEQVFSHYPQILTVGEMSSTTIDNCIRYTNPDEKELSMVFNFHHLKVDYPSGQKWAAGELDFGKLKSILNEWQVGMQAGEGWNALFWCNHDQPRVVTRFGDDQKYHKESAKMLGTALHFMQGTPYIYQGEEFGMTDPGFSRIEEYRDVETINAYHLLQETGISEQEIMKAIKQKSRDNSRTPMQWMDAPNGGFTAGTPWIHVANNYPSINAQRAQEDQDSIWYHYQKLIQLRKKHDVIAYGDFTMLYPEHPQIYAYVRQYGAESLVVVNNFYAEPTEFVLPKEIAQKAHMEVILTNYPDVPATLDKFTLRPYESLAIVIK
ncbi:alpha,alpha-phosphotrehalase [Brevibacillus laterosporus]|uniref:Alpha,alpha-phosphotrehalase n=1 Tax=Brevibacillus laterosporus LMG 15441 TaxID=1042163 RepID=A0A075R6S8_BRELA|nr:alpha,alpha-phosphotrehalase [Brevibacillus laterosporus]AIG25285.1 trehalose-6-phosphate hydrolase [Brevibacillus laterosporus LMG 15441]RJL10498.1 alpha,alpha-phosphotrehalase [Brevibacillus laterosporus]TPH14961.1 alpha,alpha-phosphotrehalase [Brevibacillus laterosporus]